MFGEGAGGLGDVGEGVAGPFEEHEGIRGGNAGLVGLGLDGCYERFGEDVGEGGGVVERVEALPDRGAGGPVGVVGVGLEEEAEDEGQSLRREFWGVLVLECRLRIESCRPSFCIRSFRECSSAILLAVELLVNASTVGSSELVGPSMGAVSAMMELAGLTSLGVVGEMVWWGGGREGGRGFSRSHARYRGGLGGCSAGHAWKCGV